MSKRERAADQGVGGNVADVASSAGDRSVGEVGSPIGQVWVLVEPLGMDAEYTLGIASYPEPPTQLFAEADRHLGLGGSLLDHAARTRIVPERVSHMTDMERAAYLTRRLGSERWSSFPAYRDNLRYILVVVHGAP